MPLFEIATAHFDENFPPLPPACTALWLETRMAPQWQLKVYQSSRSLIPGSGELKASQHCHVLLPLIWTRCFGKGLTHCLRPCRGSGHRLTSPGMLKVSRSTLHSALCERPSVSVGAHRSRSGLLHDWSGSRCASSIYTQLCVVVIIWLF